jgi:hypothetical protein
LDKHNIKEPNKKIKIKIKIKSSRKGPLGPLSHVIVELQEIRRKLIPFQRNN